MIVIPAIDLKNGCCVRLEQGLMDKDTVFNDNPGAQAAEWQTYLAENFDKPETMFYTGQAGEAFYSIEDGRYIVDGLK